MSRPAQPTAPLRGSLEETCFTVDLKALLVPNVHQTFIFIVSYLGEGRGMVHFYLSFTVCLAGGLFLFFCSMELKLFIKCHFYCCGLLRGFVSPPYSVNLAGKRVEVIFSPFYCSN